MVGGHEPCRLEEVAERNGEFSLTIPMAYVEAVAV
jgi:hypothetical protein